MSAPIDPSSCISSSSTWEDRCLPASDPTGAAARATAACQGVKGEARWIRDTAAGILDEFARPRRVCPTLQTLVDRFDEISELRKELGKARRADRSNRTKATEAARRDLRRAIRRAKKACWNTFLKNANRRLDTPTPGRMKAQGRSLTETPRLSPNVRRK